ncbi:hypothetical protein ACHHYP_20264 [Achlya hypogyna]|uniref:Uncharacterized protein n=1 Tax=Achlya hypogyna TaxID=1202772 RepID=A0A1V9YUN8_ACHHY|nr:hypothetical protein ACHHYP_20264 [Achlya hypogyna]
MDRLELWSHRTRSLVGKVVILQAVCLPVLWYQLTWLPPDKQQAALIDRLMLQFLHDEPISQTRTRHLRTLTKISSSWPNDTEVSASRIRMYRHTFQSTFVDHGRARSETCYTLNHRTQ